MKVYRAGYRSLCFQLQLYYHVPASDMVRIVDVIGTDQMVGLYGCYTSLCS